MAASKAVAKQEAAAVPDLYRGARLDIGSDDVALPKIKKGESASDFVENELVERGCIFSCTSVDDPDPVELLPKGDETGVLFHVISLTKGKSVSEGGELVTFDFDDPDAPPEAWTTYKYMVALPEHDVDVPYQLLLTKSSQSTAKQINTLLVRNEPNPPHTLAFRLTLDPRKNAKGSWFIFQARQVDATDEGVAIANRLAVQMSGTIAETQATGNEPAI